MPIDCSRIYTAKIHTRTYGPWPMRYGGRSHTIASLTVTRGCSGGWNLRPMSRGRLCKGALSPQGPKLYFLRPSDDVCCIAVSSDNHTCVTSTDVNNHATLGIVCGAQVPKCEPARVASRRNVWGTRCERSDVSCETLCRCACALVDCVSKCVTKKCGNGRCAHALGPTGAHHEGIHAGPSPF